MSKYSDIIILGPTSSGKSDLANFIASNISCPIFNCDAIQIYKDLNKLTNKPHFIKQIEENGQLVSYTESSQSIDSGKWNEFTFRIISRRNKNILIRDFESSGEFLNFIVEQLFGTPNFPGENHLIRNYLFDIKMPTNEYSLADFRSDIERINSKEKLDTKIITGGTVYYAYHYIFGTVFGNGFQDYSDVNNLRDKISEISLEELIGELTESDPDSLKIIDLNNKQRVAKAIEFIRRTGRKFSEDYFKEMKLLEDFILIMILPKDKEKYYQRLDSIVESRMNDKALREIQFLIEKYGEKVISWLEQVSYEYKYGIQLIKNKEQRVKIIEELKLAERHYAKRQMTFLKKLEKDLNKFL